MTFFPACLLYLIDVDLFVALPWCLTIVLEVFLFLFFYKLIINLQGLPLLNQAIQLKNWRPKLPGDGLRHPVRKRRGPVDGVWRPFCGSPSFIQMLTLLT